ncbi:MAG: PQQ-dependent sugar dehydrogenase [Bacteroidia bacterium]
MMNSLQTTVITLAILLLASVLQAQPQGFVDVLVLDNLSRPNGITFDDNGQMYLWEKAGKVFVVQNGVLQTTPLVNIQEEVSSYGDLGLNGFTLDPDFLNNGYIYLFYSLDKHHLLFFGTPSYNPWTSSNQQPSVARLTRYQADANTNFTTLVPNSRTILIGTNAADGFPILSSAHGNGGIHFGTDGSLLVGMGDSYLNGSNFQTAGFNEGFIAAEDTVGPWRSQRLDNPNGKIHRIDPATGNGLASNPFYDAANPRSARSRIHSFGIRNPFSFIIKPNTGSHNIADGDPGVIIVADVGENQWEEMNILVTPGENYGWPAYAGISSFGNYDNADNSHISTPGGCGQSFYKFRDFLSIDGTWPDPCNPGSFLDPATYPLYSYVPPALDYRHQAAVARVPDGFDPDTLGRPGTTVTGESFLGKCIIAGIYYTGSDFPAQYRDRFLTADFSSSWLRIIDFDPITHALVNIDTFQNSGLLNLSYMAQSPTEAGLFYVNNLDNEVRKIVYQPSNLPPLSVIGRDKNYGPEPLSVQFSGAGSSDPDADPITYEWDFDDASPLNTTTNPTHVFNPANGQPTAYYVTLEVSDPSNENNTATQVISVNNTPPVIQSTSLDAVSSYPMSFPTTYPLSAVVLDNEHTNGQLKYTWLSSLYHDNHNHPEPEDTIKTTSLVVSNIGCDTILYFVRTQLIVEDGAGLMDTVINDIYPDCGGPIVQTDWLNFAVGQNTTINVLANDQINGSPFDFTTITIVNQPVYGSVTVNTATGEIVYTPSAGNDDDEFAYMITDQAGNPSAVGLVNLTPTLSPILPIQWLEFKAERNTNGVSLNWLVAGEKEGEYSIERANDAQTFVSIAKVASYNTRIYNFTDESPLEDSPYYRIRYIDADGEMDFSPVRKVLFSPQFGSSLIVHPNPVPQGQDVVIKLGNALNQAQYLQVIDVQGRTVFEQRELQGVGEVLIHSANWAAGSYLIKLTEENDRLRTGKMIIR